MNPILICAYLMIFISALVKIFALRTLADKTKEPQIAQKQYMRLNITSYCLLLPGVAIWAYLTFFLK